MDISQDIPGIHCVETAPVQNVHPIPRLDTGHPGLELAHQLHPAVHGRKRLYALGHHYFRITAPQAGFDHLLSIDELGLNPRPLQLRQNQPGIDGLGGQGSCRFGLDHQALLEIRIAQFEHRSRTELGFQDHFHFVPGNGKLVLTYWRLIPHGDGDVLHAFQHRGLGEEPLTLAHLHAGAGHQDGPGSPAPRFPHQKPAPHNRQAAILIRWAQLRWHRDLFFGTFPLFKYQIR